MTKRIIADEACVLYDLATLIAVDLTAHLAIDGRGDKNFASRAGIRDVD